MFALYLRVSSNEQAQAKEGSLVSQKQRCEAYLKYQGIEKESLVYQEEGGRSGKDTNRPAYQKLLADIRLGLVKTVICTELSRISRSVSDFYKFFELCQNHGVDFVSLREQFDTSTSHGRLMLGIFSIFAQFEREQVSERTSANMQARASRGLYNGGILYGYRPRPGQKGYLDLDQDEAKIVNLIFDQYLQLGSYCEVAKWLNAQGYRTREYQDKKGKKQGGVCWNKNTIYQMLRNPIYVGKKRLKSGDLVQGVWESILSQEKFDQAQSLFEKNKSSCHNSENPKGHVFVLSGLVHCQYCQRKYESGSGTGRNGVHYYYIHTGSKRKPDCQCPRSLPATVFEQSIYEKLSCLLDNPSLVDATMAECHALEKQEIESMQDQIELLEKNLMDIEQESNAILSKMKALEEDEVRTFVQPRLKDLREKREVFWDGKRKLEADLLRLKSCAISRKSVEESLLMLKKSREEDSQTQRRIMGLLINKVEIGDGKISVEIKTASESGSEAAQTGSPVLVAIRTVHVDFLSA